MDGSIPIENVYYLFCYAWDRFREGKSLETGTTNSPKIWDLFASVLSRGVARLLRRGLDRNYLEVQEDMPSIRGRIVINDTLRRNLLLYGRAHCRFDELRHDVPYNQIIKATISLLGRVEELDGGLKHELLTLRRSMSGVSDIRLEPSRFRRIQLSRNNGHYDLLLKICQLVNSALLPEENGQGAKFVDIFQDEVRMSSVFEMFVRNFYGAEQNEFSVKNKTLTWNAKALDPNDEKYIPEMWTDITLRSKSRTIIIDTKYYKETLREHMGQRRVKSENLYQLYAYVQKCKPSDAQVSPVEGLLLYPTVKQEVDLRYVIDGHSIRIKTIDLNRHWTEIHDDLLGVLDENAITDLHPVP